MTHCDYDPETRTCRVCGHVAKRLPTHRNCIPPRIQPWRPVDVGALVEKGLTAVGITPELVEKLTGTADKPGGCGCGRRKKWLTEKGNEVQIAARNALLAAKKFYVGD